MPDTTNESLRIHVQKTQESFEVVHDNEFPRLAVGTFFFVIDITALGNDLYVPTSVASGKKPAGFIYQIEGTAAGSIVTTDIKCVGEGITQIVLGTIQYTKIPAGMTATFRIRVEMKGRLSEEYRVYITQIHYKLDPADARYEKSVEEISSDTLRFK